MNSDRFYSTEMMRCNLIVAVAAGFTGAEFSASGQVMTPSEIIAASAARALEEPTFLKYCKAVAGAVLLVHDTFVAENENTGKTVN